MRRPKWIDPRVLVFLHAESLAEHGGLPGMRDPAALDSALARPQNRYAYRKSVDLADLAASYAFGIIRNHPFTDGNKRAGLLAIGLSLAVNGDEFRAEQVETVQTIMKVAAGRMVERDWANWIGANTRRQQKL